MRRLTKLICTLALATILTIGLLCYRVPYTSQHVDTIIWAEPKLEQIYAHGENIHFVFAPGYGQAVQVIKGQQRVYSGQPRYINEALYIPALESGSYGIYVADLRVRAPHDYAFEGYTITRNGGNLHYRFYSEQGYLCLRVAALSELPDGVYDIIINAGHGGAEYGATIGSRYEKDENLKAALYMGELFAAQGLKVALTRDGDYYPGQIGVANADITPYAEHGEVDLIYLSQAKYCLASHLNASPNGEWRGYQLYRSVRASTAWQLAIARQYDAIGHSANDILKGYGDNGIYRRYSQDDPATGRDYYYILRETGGIATTPIGYAEALPQRNLSHGAESILLEHLFLDNRADREYWDANWQRLVQAVVRGCLDYWGIAE